MKTIILPLLLTFILANSNAQTKIIAHRGFSGMAPENTLVAFQKAIEIGADYFELDVRKTKDDSLIVIHDASVDRTSSNTMKGIVSEMSYSELAAVKAGYSERFGDKYKNERIPTLREALLLAKGKIKVAIELKVYGVEREVVSLVDELDMKDEVIIFSFYYPVLAKIRKLDKLIPILYLEGTASVLTIDYADVIEANAVGAGPGAETTDKFIDLAHDYGIEVWKWTVNEKAEMKKLFELGIDGLITDYPDAAIGMNE